MLRGCSTSSAPNCKSDSEFPKHPLYALSATYFFMTGRYDPVSEKLTPDGHWTFHLMMMIYVLFTVILMLNVLIALINTAFSKSDETWTQVWLENRLTYVENAENLWYHVEGYKRRSDRLPTAVYYTATSQQVAAYEKRFKLKSESTREDKRMKDQPVDMSTLLREMKLTVATNGILSKRIRLDDSKEIKDHNKSISRRFEDMTPNNGDVQSEEGLTLALACQVEELKLQLVETRSHMDRRVDGLQEQLNQIRDLLMMSPTSFTRK
ncbi:hypothetical protein EDD11_005925 [Mortierella claussenii]|nr:hypothetical protein EDD11_005925 [Mortierella claussenii]